MPTLPSGGRVQPYLNRNEQIAKKSIGTDQVDGGSYTEGALETRNNLELNKNHNDNMNDERIIPKRAINDKENRDVKNLQRINRSESNSIGSSSSLNNSVSRDPEPNTSNSNSMTNLDDTKSTTSSAQCSVGSETNEPKRTLLNKYVKKVKSLIKK